MTARELLTTLATLDDRELDLPSTREELSTIPLMEVLIMAWKLRLQPV